MRVQGGHCSTVPVSLGKVSDGTEGALSLSSSTNHTFAKHELLYAKELCKIRGRFLQQASNSPAEVASNPGHL